jgi:hypothetical protein
VSPARYELGFCIPEDGNLQCYRRESVKSYLRMLRCTSVAIMGLPCSGCSGCSPTVQTGSSSHTASYTVGVGGSLAGVKPPRGGADHSAPYGPSTKHDGIVFK